MQHVITYNAEFAASRLIQRLEASLHMLCESPICIRIRVRSPLVTRGVGNIGA